MCRGFSADFAPGQVACTLQVASLKDWDERLGCSICMGSLRHNDGPPVVDGLHRRSCGC